MGNIIYYLSLTIYLCTVSLFMTYFGIIWNKYETKYKRNPKILLILVYILSMIILNFGFDLQLIPHFLFNIFIMGGVFFGTKMQIIGLTGGIATGKSTISSILS